MRQERAMLIKQDDSHPNPYVNYRISSNNSRGRLFLFSHKMGAIIRGSRLFQILLTGRRALNIRMFYSLFSIQKKIITSNKLNIGFLSVPNLVP